MVSARSANDGPKLSLVRVRLPTVGSNVYVAGLEMRDVIRLVGQLRREQRDGVAEELGKDLRQRRLLRPDGRWNQAGNQQDCARPQTCRFTHAGDCITNKAEPATWYAAGGPPAKVTVGGATLHLVS